MKIGTWLLSLMSPMLGRILSALGFSVVTITGMQAVLGELKTAFVDKMGALPADMINVFLLAGGGTAIGIMTGALTTKFLLWQVQNAVQVLGKNSS